MENNLYERAFTNGYNESYRKGYKAACLEIYERLVMRGYSKEEARELSGIEEEDIVKYSGK